MRRAGLNALYIGLISGLIVPFLTLLIIYLFRNTDDSFLRFIKVSIDYSILEKLISLASIPDALLFFIFIWTEKLKSARGVILALFVICVIVIILKIMP